MNDQEFPEPSTQPSPPALMEQFALATFTEPRDVSEALQWKYAFRYLYYGTPADTVVFDVAFNQPASSGTSPEQHELVQTLDTLFDAARGSTYYTALYLVRTDENDALPWPSISLGHAGGAPVSLGNGIDSERGRKYDLPSGIETFDSFTLDLQFGPLSLATIESASLRAQTIRAGEASPWTAFPGPAVAMLAPANDIAIGAWSWNAATNPLAGALTQAVGSIPRVFSCAVNYTSSQNGFPISVPVTLLRAQAYDSTVAAALVNALQQWYEAAQPSTNDAQWQFDVDVFATVDAAQPILSLHLVSAAS